MGRQRTHANGLRVATRCETREQFVAKFHRLCESCAVFIPGATRVVGSDAAFAFTLADGGVALAGTGTILDHFTTGENRFGRPGVVVGIVQLQRDTERVFEDMLVEQALTAEQPAPSPQPATAPELPPLRNTPPAMYAVPPPSAFPTPLPMMRERSVTGAIELIDPRDLPPELAAHVARAGGPAPQPTPMAPMPPSMAPMPPSMAPMPPPMAQTTTGGAPLATALTQPTSTTGARGATPLDGSIPAFSALPPLPAPRRAGGTWILAIALVAAAAAGFLLIGPLLGGDDSPAPPRTPVAMASPLPTDAGLLEPSDAVEPSDAAEPTDAAELVDAAQSSDAAAPVIDAGVKAAQPAAAPVVKEATVKKKRAPVRKVHRPTKRKVSTKRTTKCTSIDCL